MTSRRIVPSAIVLGVFAVLAFVGGASSAPSDGVSVPSLAEHNAVEQRVTDTEQKNTAQDAELAELRQRVTALEATPEPTSTATPTATPTEEPTPTETATPTPTATADPSPEPITWPTPETTGPREPATETVAGLASSADGQVIERVTVNGRLTIRHDNVTVRDVTINGVGSYMLYVTDKADGTCPTGVRVEHIEIDGANAAEDDIPIYMPCGAVVDRAYVHDVGRTSRLVHNGTVSNSYVHSNRTGSSGAHRGAVGTNGGSNNQIIGNVLLCEGTGCSAAIPMYGDFSGGVNGMLVKDNLIATTGGYCVYGGSVDSKAYPEGSDVRFIGNHFSTRFFPTCGRYGVVSGFDNGVRGNEWSGNVWAETGEPVQASASGD